MCSINHDLKAIYIHIPKNGGSYIMSILETYYEFKKKKNFTRIDHDDFDREDEWYDDKYLCKFNNGKNIKLGFCNLRKKGIMKYFRSSIEYEKLFDMSEGKWRNYYKFTFVRNPYEKIVSAYLFIQSTFYKENRVPFESFHQFLKSKDDNCDNWVYAHAFKTQYQDLLNLNNELDFNYIGNFDNLNSELVTILKNIGVQKIYHGKMIKKNIKFNENIILNDYIDYYDEEILKLVNEYYEVDFKNFGFKICYNLDELKSLLNETAKNRENFTKKNEEVFQELETLGLLEEKDEHNDEEKEINKVDNVENSSDEEEENEKEDVNQDVNQDVEEVYNENKIDKKRNLNPFINFLSDNIDREYIALLKRIIPG